MNSRSGFILWEVLWSTLLFLSVGLAVFPLLHQMHLQDVRGEEQMKVFMVLQERMERYKAGSEANSPIPAGDRVERKEIGEYKEEIYILRQEFTYVTAEGRKTTLYMYTKP